MTISTTHSRKKVRAFTLPEVMISGALGSMIIAGVLSTFLMLGRSGANMSNYADMESQARRALEEFSQDVRMASAVVWNGTTSITLTVPNNYAATSGKVTYAYDSSTSASNPTRQSFYRIMGDGTLTYPKTVLIKNIVTFNYARFDRLNLPSTADTTTKRIQLSMKASTSAQTAATTSNIILSSSYILRNKYAN